MIKLKELYFRNYFRKTTKDKGFEKTLFYLFPTFQFCYIRSDFCSSRIKILFIDFLWLWCEIGVEFEKEEV